MAKMITLVINNIELELNDGHSNLADMKDGSRTTIGSITIKVLQAFADTRYCLLSLTTGGRPDVRIIPCQPELRIGQDLNRVGR
jgi:hypothetical protein